MIKIDSMELKISWMIRNGFVKAPKLKGYVYNGEVWSLKRINETKALVIMTYKKYYDGLIDKETLDYIKEKSMREAVNEKKNIDNN
jgi:hypothetical protein